MGEFLHIGSTANCTLNLPLRKHIFFAGNSKLKITRSVKTISQPKRERCSLLVMGSWVVVVLVVAIVIVIIIIIIINNNNNNNNNNYNFTIQYTIWIFVFNLQSTIGTNCLLDMRGQIINSIIINIKIRNKETYIPVQTTGCKYTLNKINSV